MLFEKSRIKRIINPVTVSPNPAAGKNYQAKYQQKFFHIGILFKILKKIITLQWHYNPAIAVDRFKNMVHNESGNKAISRYCRMDDIS